MITIGLPLYLLFGVGSGVGGILIDVFVLGNEESPSWVTLAGIISLVLLSTLFILFSVKTTDFEVKTELERYAFLFQDPTPLNEEKVLPTCWEGEYCEMTREGLSVRIDELDRGQVFDESPENVFFVPWERAHYFLVTNNTNRRVHFGLAVVLPYTGEEEGFEDLFVVPIDKKVYDAMYAFGLMDKVALDFAYMRYNPKDAFKQILNFGRVAKLHDKNTGKKLKNEEEMFRW